MEWIATFFVWLFGNSYWAAVARAVIVAAVSYAATAAAKAKLGGWRGDSQQISLDPNHPRTALVGRCSTAGSLVDVFSWPNPGAEKHNNLMVVIALADHKCAGLVGAWWKGRRVTIEEGSGAVIECRWEGEDFLWVKFHDGDWNQAADTELIANSAGEGDLAWTSADRGRGVCYVTIRAKFNDNQKVNLVSIYDVMNEWIWEVDGMPVYDRRLDSSVGGSGAQRWNNQATWTHSSNAAVIGENLLRGFRVENTAQAVGSRDMDVFYGLGLTDADLPFAENVAAMNACDDAISLKAGGTEARYRIGGPIKCDAAPEEWVDEISEAMAGDLIFGPGRWFWQAGVAQTPVRYYTDADFRMDAGSKWKPYLPLGEVENAIYGRFADPAAYYGPVALPPRTSTIDEAADGTRKEVSLDLSMVTSQSQGQRVMEIRRRRARRQGRATKPASIEDIGLEAGDWVEWTSARYGWTKTFKLRQAEPKVGDKDFGQVMLQFEEVSTSDYAWSAGADELDRTEPVILGSADLPDTVISNLEATGLTILIAEGEAAPALEVSFDAVTDNTAYAVRVQYRVVGSPVGAAQILTETFAINPHLDSGTVTKTITVGLLARTDYEVRAAVLTNPPQDEVYSNWVEADEPSGGFTATYSLQTNGATPGASLQFSNEAFARLGAQAVFLDIEDGVPVTFEGDGFPEPPDVLFTLDNLDALESGENYRLWVEDATGEGFTPRLRIQAPGAAATYATRTDGSATAVAAGQIYTIQKSNDPAAAWNGVYTFNFTTQIRGVLDSEGFYGPRTITVTAYYAVTNGTYISCGSWTYTGSTGSLVATARSPSVTIPVDDGDWANITDPEFRLEVTSGFDATHGKLQAFTSVVWEQQTGGSAATDRSALSGGRKARIAVYLRDSS